jgi:Lrp/AsnC family leucine-responsive transcriptional regulator
MNRGHKSARAKGPTRRKAKRAGATRRERALDEVDLTILAILQENARTPNTDIAKRIGMVPSGVFERLRRLEASGVIQGYEARIDPAAVGAGLVAFVFVRAKEAQGGAWITPGRLADIPEIQEVHHVAGEDCYLVKVRTADTISLGDLLRRIAQIPTVTSTRTTIVLGTEKETRRLALHSK